MPRSKEHLQACHTSWSEVLLEALEKNKRKTRSRRTAGLSVRRVLRWKKIPLPLTQTLCFSQITWWFFPRPAPEAVDMAAALRAGAPPNWLLASVDRLVENPDANLSRVASTRRDRAESARTLGSDVSPWTICQRSRFVSFSRLAEQMNSLTFTTASSTFLSLYVCV